MITVHIRREGGNGRMTGFHVSGHANFAKRGEDIVCSAVSAVTVGTVNSVEAIAGVEMTAEMKSGFLDANLPGEVPQAARESINVILETMLVMIRTIESSYGQYVRIDDPAAEPRPTSQ